MNIIGNPRGMNPAEAMRAAQHADQNRDGLIEPRELQFNPHVMQALDHNRDHRLQVPELAHGLARGDVFVDLHQRAIHVFPEKIRF